ncbi:MAG TPA: DUF4124 domain-containing protein [Lysobacter sp.]
MRHAPVRCIVLALLLPAAGGAAAADITIYRCTDAKGQLTLRDTPCRKGETQQTKEMQRPKDAPRSRVRTPAPAATAAPDTAPAPTRYVVMTPSQPMYECTTPDGNAYLSDTGQGNPRWVPLWTLGYPVATPYAHRDSGFYARVGGEFNGGDGRFDVRVGDRPMRPPPPPVDTATTYGAGTWIYDECHALPQEEVCDRLRDERWTLGRRYNSALQSERAEIDRQQRGIDARLGRDCGGA